MYEDYHCTGCTHSDNSSSGPTKGYVEALEHRLQVTENVLLNLLSYTSDTELSSLFSQDIAYVPVARPEKKGVEDWSQFPLDTAENIRKWQHACANQEISPSAGQSTEPDHSSMAPPGQCGLKRKTPEDFGNQSRIHRPKSPVSGLSEAQPEEARLFSTPAEFGPSQAHSHPHSQCAYQANIPASCSSETVSAALGANKLSFFNFEEGPAVQVRSSWSGAPSLSFQEQFLW